MKLLRNILDKIEPNFHKGGKLEKLFPLYDAIDTILYVPNETADHGPYIRDHVDVKRSMIFVVIALIPLTLGLEYASSFVFLTVPPSVHITR